MAITSGARNACRVSVWLDILAGTLTDISGSSASMSPNFDLETGAFRTFQSVWQNRLQCGKDASITLNVVFSTVADEGWDALITWYNQDDPGERTMDFYMPDKNFGVVTFVNAEDFLSDELLLFIIDLYKDELQ